MAPPPPPDRTETLGPRESSPPADEPKVEALGDETIDADDPDRYEQIAEHARGGLGRVVRALDKRLGRTVAVKELLRRGEHGASAEARFLREALITARLEHPGIVPVHEAGRWPSGDPYYVMKLVEGRTLKELIAERPTLRERLSLLLHVIAIADAVGYAHSEGVIHRDLKPSNVIVGSFGETIVVDWGLARDRKREVPEPTDSLIEALGSGASTVSGKVIGTPAYMAPEQARGELVDERADVYAIGAVLYELLAGTPPHHDTTPQATLDRVIAGPPRPVGLAIAHVPSELATIVGKAMARDPNDRYPNATALAEDLRRFQTGKLVSAHSYTAWSLLRKKLAQHRGVVAVAVASAVALGAVGVESFRRVVAERNIARSERGRAVVSQSQAENRQRELVLLQAVTSLREDPTATLAWLKDYRIADEDRGQVLELVDEALANGVARHVFRPGDWVFDAVFTPDGERLIVGVRDGVLRSYDLRTGLETRLGKLPSQPETISITPDGRFAIIAGSFGAITKWPLDGNGEPRTIAKVGRMPTMLELSPDAKRLLVVREAGAPEVVMVDGDDEPQLLAPKATLLAAVAERDWSRVVVTAARNEVAVVAGEQRRSLARTEKAIQRIAVSPHGDVVLIWDGSVVWRVPFGGGKLEKLADYQAAKLTQLEWSPDEQKVAIGGDLSDIKLVDLRTNEVRELRGHTDAIYTLQWTRDGRRLLSASDDGSARVWSVFDGTSIVLRGHEDDVYRARFSADETQVVTSSLDGSARVWRIDQPGTRVLTEGDSIEYMWFQGDRALVKTRSEVSWWNLSSGHRVPVFSREPGALSLGLPSSDGERIAIPKADSSIEVRQKSGPTLILRGHTNALSYAEYSRDHTMLYTSSFDGTLRRWDLATGQGTVLVDAGVPIRNFALASDGRVVAQVGDATKLIAPDGTVSELGSGPQWCLTVKTEFEPVHGRLLMRRCDSSFAILDGTHVTELATGGYHMMETKVSPDGTKIAGAMSDRTVRVWDARTGAVLEILRGHTDLPLDLAFSPDGARLASSSYDKTIRIWQLGTHRARVLRGHSGPIYFVNWQDASHIASGSRDGTIRIWDVPALELPTARGLADRIDAATTACIDVDRPTTGASPRRGT